MRATLAPLVLAAAAALVALPAHAEEVSATCRDGTTFAGTSRRGACAGHGGVQAYAAASAPMAPSAPAPTPPAAPTAQPASPPASPPTGAAPGQVWVNTTSKVYHCPGDRYFGKTRHGTYMTEVAAKAAGDHPDHGKTCF